MKRLAYVFSLATACTTPDEPALLDSADCTIDPPPYVRAIGNWVSSWFDDPALQPDVCDGTWLPRVTEVLPRAQIQDLLDKSLSVDCQPLPEQTGRLQLVLSCGGTTHANEPFFTSQIADTELQLGVQRTGNGTGGAGSIEILVVEVEDPWTITSVVNVGTCTDRDLPFLDGDCR
jgi:hypothetical protein